MQVLNELMAHHAGAHDERQPSMVQSGSEATNNYPARNERAAMPDECARHLHAGTGCRVESGA